MTVEASTSWFRQTTLASCCCTGVWRAVPATRVAGASQESQSGQKALSSIRPVHCRLLSSKTCVFVISLSNPADTAQLSESLHVTAILERIVNFRRLPCASAATLAVHAGVAVADSKSICYFRVMRHLTTSTSW